MVDEINEKQMLKELEKKGTSVVDAMATALREVSHSDFFSVVEWQVASGGKRVRPAFTLIFAEMANKPTTGILYAAAGIELIHNYSLVIDDVIDRGDLRRNRPTTRAQFGDEMVGMTPCYHCGSTGWITEPIIEGVK